MILSCRLSFICNFIPEVAKVATSTVNVKRLAMKSPLLLLGFAVLILASCSTAYRSGQTPDDVYFSPARERDAYAKVEQQQKNESRYNNYDEEYVSSEDQYLRMRVRNRARWSAFDDYDSYSYRYNNWNMHNPYSYSYNNYFNNYWSWNSWYNPYCPRVVVVSPKTNPTNYNKVRNFSLNSYTNNNYNNNRTTNVKPTGRVALRPSYNSNNQSSNSSTLGSSIRKVFSNQGNSDNYSNNNSSSRPSRTYTPSSSNNSSNSSSRSSSSSSGSSGSSSSGSGGGGVSRPTRGGN